LLPLADRKAKVARSVAELEDGRIVLFDGDVALLVAFKPAPDGEYALAGAGRLIVRGARATGVVGQPASPALTAPVD
jgi:hypothetical protein